MPRSQFPTERQGKPDLSVLEWKVRPRWHDSDHRLRLRTQGDAPTDDIRVATEASLPKLIAQEHEVVFAENLLFRKESAAQDRLHSKQIKEVSRQT